MFKNFYSVSYINLHFYKASCQSSFVKQIMPYLSNLCCNGSLMIWMVISLTAAKCKPVILTVCGFTLSCIVNICIFVI